MKLLIVTHFLDHFELAKITNDSKDRYAQRHGYDLFVQEGNYCSLGFDFQRIQIIYDLFFNDRKELPDSNMLKFMQVPDVIWWLGCDTMIMNYSKPVTDFLVPENKSFYIHKDVNGINNDSFLIRRNDWSKRWLEFILSKEPEYRTDCWYSQRVMQHNAEKPEWAEQVEILPHPGINSYLYKYYKWPDTTPGDFRKGDLLLHLPGMNLNQRLEIFQSDWIKDLIIE